jgi:acyl-CoA thioesterase-2
MANDASNWGSFTFGVEPLGNEVFTATLPGFGGLTLGASTYAAACTCEDRSFHSLQACFVRPIPPETRVELQVTRVSDGRRLARRRVEIHLDGRLHFTALASFAAPGAGPEFSDPPSTPEPPPPEALVPEEEVARAEGWPDFGHPQPLEWRWVGRPWDVANPDEESSRYQAWVRPRGDELVERELHAAAIALLSDYHSHWPVARRLGGGHFEPQGFTSLDQMVWLHRDLPWDDWRLLTSTAPLGHAGRALGHRRLYTRDGRLVASMAQEALIPGSRASAVCD